MNTVVPPPLAPGEGIDTNQAAVRAGVSERTIREWCALYRIGRRRGGRWRVSIPALDMLINGDHAALSAYLDGDRDSEAVRAYFARHRIPFPDLVSA